MSANDRQIGGSHYKGAEYQHWDFANDIRLSYLAGTASKYVARWRRHPAGMENLEKAIHYIDKAEECHVQGSSASHRDANFWRFATENKVHLIDGMIIYYIMEGEWEAARNALQVLCDESGKLARIV